MSAPRPIVLCVASLVATALIGCDSGGVDAISSSSLNTTPNPPAALPEAGKAEGKPARKPRSNGLQQLPGPAPAPEV